ncbi:MAG: transcriptional repressor LexA [Verrucomicrobia bacterium]|nr:transcriptional repressor LexA [Verrucomicrobiota bacterium]
MPYLFTVSKRKMFKELTARQNQVLQFVEDFQQENGGSPTLQEICAHFCFSSLSSAQEHLRLIERKGFLSRKPHSSRSIRSLRRDARFASLQITCVPLVGNIAAGAPTFALEEAEETLPLPKSLFRGRNLFALRVRGDSMIKAAIFDGDIAVLRSQADFTDGDIAAVVVDEEATLKRVFRVGSGLRLHAENDLYPDRVITPVQMQRSCRVAGILLGTIRRF